MNVIVSCQIQRHIDGMSMWCVVCNMVRQREEMETKTKVKTISPRANVGAAMAIRTVYD
jgi:hypothetical protein